MKNLTVLVMLLTMTIFIGCRNKGIKKGRILGGYCFKEFNQKEKEDVKFLFDGDIFTEVVLENGDTIHAEIDQKELANPPELSTYNLDFPSLIQSTTQILETVVSSSTKIEELVNNSTLNTWVQTGHQLHSERKTCVFCNNKISDDRREELRQHFDQETQNLQNRILKGIEKANKLIRK